METLQTLKNFGNNLGNFVLSVIGIDRLNLKPEVRIGANIQYLSTRGDNEQEEAGSNSQGLPPEDGILAEGSGREGNS